MTVDIPVKRVHSRQRRFIAPGAVWDLMVGIEIIGSDFEFRYDNVLHYRMDYLFGGFAALQNAIASATAAQQASASAGKRKKRLVFQIFSNFRPGFLTFLYLRSDAQGVIAAGFGKKKRSISTPDDISNVLSRTIEDDQVDVLSVIINY